MILNGEIEPMIVVTPTFYNGSDVGEDDLLTANFYQELLNDLVPAVESSFVNIVIQVVINYPMMKFVIMKK